MRHQEDPLPSGMKAIIMKETIKEYIVNPYGPHHKEDLKHNRLSVKKICDQGYTLTFDSRKCKIQENNSGRLVATA